MITIKPFILDQQQIHFYGRRVAYCGTKPNMPICFLHPGQAKLTPGEYTAVIQAVIDAGLKPRCTNQTEEYWPDDNSGPDAAGDPGSAGCDD